MEAILNLLMLSGQALVGFGFNGPFRQYFSLYPAVSQREGERRERIDESKNVQTTPTRTYCKRKEVYPALSQMDINKKVRSGVNCQTLTKYSATFFANVTEHFVEIMQKQRSNIVFQCINVCLVPRWLLKTSLGTWQTLMHEKLCLIPTLASRAITGLNACALLGSQQTCTNFMCLGTPLCFSILFTERNNFCDFQFASQGNLNLTQDLSQGQDCSLVSILPIT